jgi:hypothetical protein
MDELDIILTEQLYSARSRKKQVKRLRKLMPTEPWLVKGEKQIDLKIVFLETMINDKKIKPKRRINIKRKLIRLYVHFKFICASVFYRKKNK